ncbi:MAG: 16S rRNA (uracil(1498)-N(3))-methyltransferase [Bdellovibrionales bacterium]|nr:16S rRNA (uracil(1498)-N(3))-methyltransferase [Bdellovibrionales bacterium]
MQTRRYPQFFITKETKFSKLDIGTQIILNKEDSHHITSVLRLSIGDTIQLVDTKNQSAYLASLENKSRSDLKVKISEKLNLQSLKSPVETLVLANLKGKNTTLVCEKAVELGVSRIIIFNSERSVKKLSLDDKTLDRYNKICLSAAKQSNKLFIPEVILCSSLNEAITQLFTICDNSDLFFCCSLKQEDVLLSSMKTSTAKVHLLVGAEGDFTDEEYEQITAKGWKHISLGPYVLRSETAAIAGVAMLSALIGYKNEMPSM